MAYGNPVAIMRTYLAAQPILMGLIPGGLYSPRIPEGQSPPCMAFFVRGGASNPQMEEIVTVSFQFDCWSFTDDTGPLEAYAIYLELFSTLQGIQNQAVVLPGPPPVTHRIMSVTEEVSGQQIQAVDPKDGHRVLGLFQAMMEV